MDSFGLQNYWKTTESARVTQPQAQAQAAECSPTGQRLSLASWAALWRAHHGRAIISNDGAAAAANRRLITGCGALTRATHTVCGWKRASSEQKGGRKVASAAPALNGQWPVGNLWPPESGQRAAALVCGTCRLPVPLVSAPLEAPPQQAACVC